MSGRDTMNTGEAMDTSGTTSTTGTTGTGGTTGAGATGRGDTDLRRTTSMEDDVIDLLLAQHARIEELFLTVLAVTGERRQETFDELVRLLAVHETAEEEIVHPYARGAIDAGDAIVDDRLAEEHTAKQQLADLYERGPDAPDFELRLIALRDSVLAHASAEERYEFKQIRASADPGTLRAMATAVRAAESLAPTRPHPGAESAKANMLLGPPLAVVDRVRDLMRDKMPGR